MDMNNSMVIKIMIGRDSACRVYANRRYIKPLIASNKPNLMQKGDNKTHPCGANFYNSTEMSL